MIMLRFSGFLKNVSIIILTVTLLVVYAFLGRSAGILFDKNGSPLMIITKNQFFYYVFFLALGYNLIFQLFKSSYLKRMRTSRISTLKTEYRETLMTWWQFLVMSVNLFFTCFIIFTGMANNTDNYSFSSVTFIPVVGIGPLIITVLSLPVIYFVVLKNLRREQV